MVQEVEKVKGTFPGKFEEMGADIGALVDVKNKAYGDSFAKSGDILKLLYPDGIKPDQYKDMLYIIRVIDKLFRIATNKDAFGENPARDIAGYSILMCKNVEVMGTYP